MAPPRVMRALVVWAALSAAACGEPRRMDPFGGGNGADATTPPPDAAADAATQPGQCRTQAQWDDGLACTDDECVVGGRCEYTPVASRCASGQRCVPGRGCVSGQSCRAASDCNDNVACTRDLCGADGTCQNLRDDATCTGGMVCTSRGCAAAGTCATDADCDNRRFCDGVERCAGGRCMAGAARDCSDGDPCTGDICNEAMMRCDHPAVSPCGTSVMAGTYALSMPIAYTCGAGSLNVSQVMLEVSAGGVTVRGFPTALSGPAPTMGMFTATGSEVRGPCSWRYTLSGSFTMPTRFTGSWNVTFDNCSALYNCLPAFGLVTGTRQ